MTVPPADPWEGFSEDPRLPMNADLRATDVDRDAVASMLADAYAAGQLDNQEYQSRLDKAMTVKRLGEIRSLVEDLLPRTKLPVVAGPRELSKSRKAFNSMFAVWAGMAVFFTMVWFFSGGGYFWAMWPMLGITIPLVITGVRAWTDRDRA